MAKAEPVYVYIGIGANLGDREGNIGRAIALMGTVAGIRIERVSTIMETAAVGGPADSPPYLNCVAMIRTDLRPLDLLDELMRIEREIGRVRRQKWEPRVIDLDVLLFGEQIINTPELTVPHPLMHQRRFVIAPLAGLSPDVVHPALGKTVGELLKSLDESAG